ncbi:MAG: hypothetical protein HQ564_07025 [Candidatus Saganbacteria bacterium]|nr:hypothetical protein [Candidatus Saganbacteria bacterium]
MGGYLKFVEGMKSAARVFDDLAFMKMFLPLISVVGIVAFLGFGIMGVAKKKTLFLGRLIGGQVIQGGWWIEGVWAVILGVVYLITGIIMLLILGPFSLALLGLI